MYFFELEIKDMPDVVWAFTTTTDSYKNFVDQRNIIEIGTLTGAHIECKSNFGDVTIPPKTIMVTAPDTRIECNAIEEGNVTITTIAFSAKGVSIKRYGYHDVEELKVLVEEISRKKRNTLFIPEFFTNDFTFTHIISLIKNVSASLQREDFYSYYKSKAFLLEILTDLSDAFLKEIHKDDKKKFSAASFYTRKVKAYFEDNYAQKISVSNLAEILGISPDYLGRCFSQETGISISEYVNSLRVQKARELNLENRYSASQIARMVGICDKRYLEKLFKRHFGISMQECYRIDREITLYHSKPWELDSLEKDPLKEKYNDNGGQ